MTQLITNDDEAREYNRKKLYELSLKSIGDIPQLDEPNEEQKGWMHFRLTHSSSWPRVHENKIGDYKNWL
jgi:hypothetical protein